MHSSPVARMNQYRVRNRVLAKHFKLCGSGTFCASTSDLPNELHQCNEFQICNFSRDHVGMLCQKGDNNLF